MDNSTSGRGISQKFWIIVALAIVVVFAGIYLFLNRGVEKSGSVVELKSEMTGLELAEKLDIWVEESMKTEDGNYILRRNCSDKNGKKQCVKSKAVANNVWTLPLGYFSLYQATGNKEYRRLADSYLETALRRECEKKIGHECMHYALPLGIFYSETNDAQYLRFNELMRPSIDEHLKYHEDIVAGRVKDDHLTNDYFMHAGHIMDFYNLTKENKYRDAAIAILNEGQKKAKDTKVNTALYKVGSFTVARSHCFELLTDVDFYRVTKEKKYLSDSVDLINKAQFHKNPERYAKSWDLAFCEEGYLGMYQLTGEKQYLNGASEIMSWVVKAFMDNPSNNYYTGKFSILESRGGSEKNLKDLGLNMWFMSELARLKDVKFELK